MSATVSQKMRAAPVPRDLLDIFTTSPRYESTCRSSSFEQFESVEQQRLLAIREDRFSIAPYRGGAGADSSWNGWPAWYNFNRS